MWSLYDWVNVSHRRGGVSVTGTSHTPARGRVCAGVHGESVKTPLAPDTADLAQKINTL